MNTAELIKLNCLLAKLTKSHQYTKTLKLFTQIQTSQHNLNLKPDQYTFSTTLTAAANLRDILTGAQLHAHVIRTGFKTYPHVSNTLLSLYAKTDNLVYVKRVFSEIMSPDVYSWTTFLSACTNLGEADYACQMLERIPERNEALSPVWNAVITGCVDNGYLDVALNVGKAYKVFQEAEENVCDEITYNAMIAGLVSLGRDEDAFVMFKNMLRVGLGPTERTFVSVMSSGPCHRGVIQVHSHAIKTGLNDFSSVGNAAMTMYSNCKDLQAVHMVFNTLEEKDRVSWNTIITSYAQVGLSKEAISAYMQMQHQGIEPDEFTIGSLLATLDSEMSIEMILAVVIKDGLISKTEVSNALISSLSKHNAIDEAYSIFTETNCKNSISWNSMICAFHLNGCSVHGLDLFSEMLVSGLPPDVFTLSIVLNICAGISDFRHGKEVHGYILKSHYFHETSLGNALIALYAKCGVLDWSLKVFNMMKFKDVVSWNSMISAYAQHGRGEEAVQCFESMQKSKGVKVQPDHTTFTVALTACSHAGLVNAGVEIFNSMVNEYGLEPGVDHFSCVVDLLGRAGYLDAVENVLKCGGFKVHSNVWWALFSSCASHGDLRLGRIVAGFLLEAEEDKASVYVVLANILADSGHWEEAEDVRKMMRSYGAVKQPGYSWIRS
ncbi:tetratricopeptide repeat (TPR)-like superfamily protein [Artemisia annua]|uniref:Tetratricopeptide repeat (TPR)-like superfamily protein n=1 Tax=Artemisia annua TaxID=35608 RepID=A0A2U1PVW3_ARTAN|nr:tetratricopeptide repeat (TPR)-like superfamily protein [Artemisia annua]